VEARDLLVMVYSYWRYVFNFLEYLIRLIRFKGYPEGILPTPV